jgi:hypothetical protein
MYKVKKNLQKNGFVSKLDEKDKIIRNTWAYSIPFNMHNY